jgi:hypothetical protein
MERSPSREVNIHSDKNFPFYYYEVRRFVTVFTRASTDVCPEESVQVQGCVTFRNALFFYVELLGPQPNIKLEYHPLSAVRDCWFNVLPASVHIWRFFPSSVTQERAMSW